MESEEANGGGLIPPATGNPSEESPDPIPAKRGHNAISESVEMSMEHPGSAEGAQISIGQGPLSPFSAGRSAEMCGRPSNPVPAGLGQAMSDPRQQQGLLEKDPAVQETRDPPLNSDQRKLAHPESSQYSSFPSTVPQAPTTHDKSPQIQSPALHIEFPQDQEQALTCHAAVPQAKHKGTSETDTVPSHFLMCEEVSEVHGKTETLPDETVEDPPLQGLDATYMTIRELLLMTEAAEGTNKEPSPGMDSVSTVNPIFSVDNDEKAGGLQRGTEYTDSSSSHHPPNPLSDDSQRNPWLTGGNADGKMLLSAHERRNNALATDQKTDMPARQSLSGAINLLPEEKKGGDNGQAEGSIESLKECVFRIGNAAKNTELEEWQQEQLEWEEESAGEERMEQKQPEQQETESEKLEKELKPAQEESVLEREDQKEKKWNELEQEAGLEAPPPAFRPRLSSLSKHNWDLHDVGESIFSAEGTGLASPPQESFSSAQHPGEDTLSSIMSKACLGEKSVRAQSSALIMSGSLNPEDGSPMMPSPIYQSSEHWGDMGVSVPSNCISINGQDCGETNQDDRARIGEGGHNDRDGRTVQSSDNAEAISLACREITSSPGAGNPDSPRTLDPSFGANDLGSLGPANPHPVAENLAFPIHHDFTPVSFSDLNSAADPSQEDADEGSPVSPAGCIDLDKAPSSVQEVSSQNSPTLQEAASGEGASVSTSTVGVQTPRGLVTSEKGLNEEPSAQPSISPIPTESLPKDRDGVESNPVAPPTVNLEPPQAPNMAPTPPDYLEEDQRHQNLPTRSFVFQGKETEASRVHAVQQDPLLDQSHLDLEAEEPGTERAFNSLAQPSEEVPVPERSSPPAPMPDANQPLAPEPSSPPAAIPDANQPPAPEMTSPLDAMSEVSQLNHPPAPELSSPLAPIPDANQPPAPEPSSSLDAMSEVSQLNHPPAPEPSSPFALTPDANQLNHPPAPEPSSPLDAMAEVSQLNHPPAPEPSSPLAPAPDASQPPAPELTSPLNLMPETSQLNLPQVSDPSSPLVLMPDANQHNHPPAPAPSSLLALMSKAIQLLEPLSLVSDSNGPPVPAPDIDQPPSSVSNSIPPLDCIPYSSQLQATVSALASVPAADGLVHTPVSAPDVEDGIEKPPLMQMTEEEVIGVQWNPVISFTQDVVDSSNAGVSLLAKSSDFLTLENEAPMGHSDNTPEIIGQHTDTPCGKSPSDHTARPSLGGWRTSTDSHSRHSVQSPPVLAFSNPIHFLQFSPPSPPTIRKLYRQEAVFEEPQWDQAQAGPTRVDTRNATASAEMMEAAEDVRTCNQRMEGQGEPLPFLVQGTRHAPLEKSSSLPDKIIRVDMKELGLNVGSQENPIKRRAKSKDWHRQGLKKVSVPSANLQEAGPHKDQSASSDTVILREKKSADTLESLRRRHSKLINSSKLLYQEYSDVALNKAIQSQKRADILAEDIELSSPSSPRLRRKVLSPQDSYLQRLSVSSTASLWQDIPKVRGSRILLSMSQDVQKLQEAKFELIMSEASYLRSLNVAVDHFQCSSELQALLTKQERKWLFSRLQDVRDVSACFLFDLEEKFEEDMFTFNVCDVALRHAPEFRKVYLPYVTNQTYQEQTFQRLLNGNARFQQVLERLESDPVCQRLSLKSFLILPFQRITRLKLLLQNILKRIPPGSDEVVQATQAYDALEKLIKDCNENVQRMKSTEELIYLRQKIDFECKIFPLVSQSRRLVKCGELTALDYNTLRKFTTRPIYLHLFNDRLLLSRPREGGRFVVFDHAAFSDVRGEKCEMKLHGANKNVFRLFLLRNNQGKRVEFLFRTETHSAKLRWISALAPPQGEPDLLESPDSPQVQCIRTYKARENDELALEKADIIMVMQNSNDGWMEGVKLSDGERGWFPSEHVELISSKHARQMNLKEEQRVKNAKQQVFCKK